MKSMSEPVTMGQLGKIVAVVAGIIGGGFVILQPFLSVQRMSIQQDTNTSNITEILSKMEGFDRLADAVAEHEESIDRIGPLVVDLKASDLEQTTKLNQLIDFANSGDRFTAQDGAYLRQRHDDDIENITEKIDEMKLILREIQEEIKH